MAWNLFKGGDVATVKTERFLSTAAIAANTPVFLAPGASGVGLGKVTTQVGVSSSAVPIYGISAHATTAADQEILVIPLEKDQVWVVDSVADTNATSISLDNYLAATSLLLTVGASTAQGKKCHIIGVLGATGDRKYLVKPANLNV